MVPSNIAREIPKLVTSRWLKQEYPIYPLLGLVSTIVGTLIAIFILPEETTAPSALFPCALAMTLGLAIAPFAAACRSPRTLLRTEHVLVLAPIYWLLLDLLQQAYSLEYFPNSFVAGTFLSIGLFTTGVWLAALMRPLPMPTSLANAADHRLNPTLIFSLILVFFSIAIIKFAYPCDFNPMLMFFHLGSDRWSAPWARETLGGWSSFIDHLDYFGYLLPTLTTLLIVRSRRLDFRVILAISLSVIMTAFLAQAGGRRIIGVVLGAAIICWVLEQQKLKLKQIIITLVSVAMVLGIMQWMLEVRNDGFQALLQKEHPEFQYKHLHIDDNFLRLAQTIALVPRYYPYVYEKQIIFTLVRPIPRVFWPDKPVDPGFDLPSALGVEGISYSYTVIGDWYICAGWIGIFFGGIIYGGFARMVGQLLTKNTENASAIVYSLCTMALFAGFRSMLELVLMSYAVLAWMLISWLMLPKRKILKG
ncbi:O-antigen polymerase [Pleurocapsa sp. PCC 7319]|uniref:O-antigen polymerase n=1 Tax=Pleurocapsa sp. PCC 7319 TaxID=118161 RepID=UPI0003481753|nr:O-antigen polymerase [Pleurocapsa sp. PCC 7319]